MAFSKIPLNLPHAGTIAQRIAWCLEGRLDWMDPKNKTLSGLVRGLQELLKPYRMEGENPAPAEAEEVRQKAAGMGRDLVAELERLKLKGDSVGLSVRNLFECLEMGEEGAEMSLRAGENPDSAQRPR